MKAKRTFLYSQKSRTSALIPLENGRWVLADPAEAWKESAKKILIGLGNYKSGSAVKLQVRTSNLHPDDLPC